MQKTIPALLRSGAVFISIIMTFSIGYTAAQNNSPTAVVERLNATLIKAMQGGDTLGFDGRYALFEPVIQASFALDLMTRISMGKHWKDLSAERRNQMIALYLRWSTATYAHRFNTYAGQYFEVLADQNALGNFVNIRSRMIKASGETVAFLYKLKKVRLKWLIVDIHIKGVSQLANTRAQFTSVLESDGYDALVKKLEEKIEDLSH